MSNGICLTLKIVVRNVNRSQVKGLGFRVQDTRFDERIEGNFLNNEFKIKTCSV